MPRLFISFSLRIACCVFSVLATVSAHADTHFDAGVIALQRNDLQTARTEFQASAQANPTQAQVYYDLGLVEYKDNHAGLAIGLWRKALALNPNDRLSEAALRFATKKLAHSSIAHEAETWEAFRDAFLAPTPLWNFILLANLLFFFSGWLLLGYFGKRKQAFADDSPLPGPPVIGSLFSALCLIFIFFSFAKFVDLQTPRATITVATLSARTAPDEKSASLYDLFEGLEVVVGQASADWLQVTYPGGLTGWVPKSSVVITSGIAP